MFKHKKDKDPSSFTHKMTGFMRYLNNFTQYAEDDFNKVAMRLYIKAVCTFNRKYIALIAALLAIYAQDPAWYRPKVAAFNSQINRKLVFVARFCAVFETLAIFGGVALLLMFWSDFSYVAHNYETGHLTLGGLIVIFTGYILMVLLEQAFTIMLLLRFEKRLYKGALPQRIYPLSLNVKHHILPTRRDRFDISFVESDIAYLVSNVPPYTINDKHMLLISQLFPYFNRTLDYTISKNYHVITPYTQKTITTKQDAENLLIYLGTYVKQHTKKPGFFDGFI